MKTIYKYTLDGIHTTKVSMPKGANVTSFDVQNNQFCIWALVDTESPMEERYFTIVGTGWELDGDECYIGMVQQGSYVWHCLEVLV